MGGGGEGGGGTAYTCSGYADFMAPISRLFFR